MGRMLEEPFVADPKMGVTGSLRIFSACANSTFLIFFCVMIKRSVWDHVGPLDEVFGKGAGEDTDWCVRAYRLGYHDAQVPTEEDLQSQGHVPVSAFPI